MTRTSASAVRPRVRLLGPDDPAWEEWLALVPRDVYHTAGYHRHARGSGEGEPYLAVIGDRDSGFAWPYLLRAVADVEGMGSSDSTDVHSVYGYPGPLIWGCSPGHPFIRAAFASVCGVWRDQKAVSAAAQTFRQNPKIKVETVLTELGVGEALVSMLDEEGKPGIVDRAKIVPPRSQVGAISPDQRKQVIQSSSIAGHYEKVVDRESAYEKLQARAGNKAASADAPPIPSGGDAPQPTQPSVLGTIGSVFKPTIGPRGAIHDSMATSMVKSAARAASSQMGRQIIRGILGSFMGGGSRR